MGIGSVGSKGGIMAEANVVPLIDILLVLLVIFMIIPHRSSGLEAQLPQTETSAPLIEHPEVIIVRITQDGKLWLNQTAVAPEDLGARLERVFATRIERVAFLQGDRCLEFQPVAQVLDVMHAAGASPVGLLTSELEKKR